GVVTVAAIRLVAVAILVATVTTTVIVLLLRVIPPVTSITVVAPFLLTAATFFVAVAALVTVLGRAFLLAAPVFLATLGLLFLFLPGTATEHGGEPAQQPGEQAGRAFGCRSRGRRWCRGRRLRLGRWRGGVRSDQLDRRVLGFRRCFLGIGDGLLGTVVHQLQLVTGLRFDLIVADPFDQEVRCFQVRIGDHQHSGVVRGFDIAQHGAFFVEQE